jgi:hypothetical protein
MKKTVDPPLLTQKLCRTLLHMISSYIVIIRFKGIIEMVNRQNGHTPWKYWLGSPDFSPQEVNLNSSKVSSSNTFSINPLTC